MTKPITNSDVINQITKIQKDLAKNLSILENITASEKNIKKDAYKKIVHDGFLEMIRLAYILEGEQNAKNMTRFSNDARHMLLYLGIEPQIQNKWLKKSDILYELNDHSSKSVNVTEDEFDSALPELISAGVVSEKYPQSKPHKKRYGQLFQISFDDQSLLSFVQRHYYYIPK